MSNERGLIYTNMPKTSHIFRPRSRRDEINYLRFQLFVSEAMDPFGRNDEVGHVTATAFITDEPRTHGLFLRHAKLGLWLPPGGHCDGDPDVLAVARREASEETGLRTLSPVSTTIFDIDIHTIPANARDREHLHFDVRFHFIADRQEPLSPNRESTALRWIELSQLGGFTDMPSILVLLEKLDRP